MNKEIKELFKVFRAKQILLLTVAVLVNALLAYVTFNIQYLFDYGVAGDYESLVSLAIKLVVLFVIMCVLDFIDTYRWHNLRFEAIGLLRTKVFSGLLKKDYTFFVNNTSGELLSKVMDDVVIYAQVLSTSWLMLVINSYRIIIVIVAMMFISVKVTLIICIAIPLYYFIYRGLNKKIRGTSIKER